MARDCHADLSNIGLYGNTNKLRLPFSSVREEFIVAQAREHLQYSASRDAKVSGAGIVVRTGRKWRAANAVQQAETRLNHKAILGTVAQGRAGLGSITTTRYDCQREGEAEVGAGGGASFCRGRANQQSSGHAAAGCLDEVGESDGAECHLEGHLAVEPPEDQVLDSGGL